MPLVRLLIILCALLHPAAAAPSKPLQKFEHCKFIPTAWADGDSFQVSFPDGSLHTIRLYGVDSLEMHVTDDSDARRLRAQRRYFGITGVPPKAAEAIALAKEFGRQAAGMTAALLAKPFTVHTRFRDALGDGKHPRIYAFITCADGTDLSATLVKSGLARAYGVDSDTPDGKTIDESAAMLVDLELQAAKRGVGIWAQTNWDDLPNERQIQRIEDEEFKLATGKPALTDTFQLDPNTAARDDLMKLPGIGEVTANRIIEARPYTKLADLLNVSGIGPKSLRKIMPYLKIQKPQH